MYKINNKGITLIELMIYTGMLIIVTTAVFSFLLWALRNGQRINSSREVLAAARHAFDALNEEVSTASGVYTPTSSSTQLSLSTNYNLPSGEEITYVDFFQCGAKLCRKRENSQPEAITPDSVILTNLNFGYTSTSSTPSVIVTLRLSYQAGDWQIYSSASLLASTTIALRAY